MRFRLSILPGHFSERKNIVCNIHPTHRHELHFHYRLWCPTLWSASRSRCIVQEFDQLLDFHSQTKGEKLKWYDKLCSAHFQSQLSLFQVFRKPPLSGTQISPNNCLIIVGDSKFETRNSPNNCRIIVGDSKFETLGQRQPLPIPIKYPSDS